jgi:cytochrome c-type biogenesis protein CcsB
MTILSAFFFKGTLLFYLLGTCLFFLGLWRREGERSSPATPETEGVWRPALFVTGIGFICHTLALALRLPSVPFNSLHDALSFFSWALVLIFCWIDLRYRMDVLGSFVLPLADLSLVSASALPNEIRNMDISLKTAWLGAHTTLSILGIAAFAMACVAGVMYLLQERFLKAKQFNALYDRLPSLDLLDQWNKKAILLGFPLLTVGMISGAIWSQYAIGSPWTLNNPKQLLAVCAWFFYLIVLHGRITVGWRARKAARLAIVGFVGTLFIFVALA